MWSKFKNSDSKTKWFIFNWFFYGIIIVGAGIYCYARLDFVRSGPSNAQQTQHITK